MARAIRGYIFRGLKMKCLIVGGTGFLGGAMADAMAAAGHETAILSRGVGQRDHADGVEVICADRYGDLSVLAGRDFDWVFDSCAYTSDLVDKLLDALGDDINRYVLISSISAYGDFSVQGMNEDFSVAAATDKDFVAAKAVAVEDRVTASAYGPSYGLLKRSCEIAALERLGDRATSLRVGLLVGARDYTDRLTWWVRRIDAAHGALKPMIAPAPRDAAVQIIDVRDVAQFALRCADDAVSGVLNVTGRPIGFSTILDGLIAVSESEAEINWIDEATILDAGIAPWTDLPLMVPSAVEYKYFMHIDTSKAVAAGLECRPLTETFAWVLAWDRGRRDVTLKCGITVEQERKLLG